jgi:hypothetical protein
MPGPESTQPLLVETLAGIVGNGQSLVAGPPSGDGWVVLADLLTDPTLSDSWHDVGPTRRDTDDHPASATSMAGQVARVSFEPVVDAVLTQHRAWHLEADALAVRRNDDGRYDGLAVLSPTVRVLPGDPRADDRDAVVLDDVFELHASVADEAADLLAQVLEAARIAGNPGVGGLWASVADQLVSMAVWRRAGRRNGAAAITRRFRRAMATVDVTQLTPLSPRDFVTPIAWTGGVSAAVIRAACRPRGLGPIAGGWGPDGYCGPCPLLDEETRRVLHVDHWPAATSMPL